MPEVSVSIRRWGKLKSLEIIYWKPRVFTTQKKSIIPKVIQLNSKFRMNKMYHFLFLGHVRTFPQKQRKKSVSYTSQK